MSRFSFSIMDFILTGKSCGDIPERVNKTNNTYALFQNLDTDSLVFSTAC